jgi:hypothetical protein
MRAALLWGAFSAGAAYVMPRLVGERLTAKGALLAGMTTGLGLYVAAKVA